MAFVLATIGFFLGHAHKGRQFEPHNAHCSFAVFVSIMFVLQVVLGMYSSFTLKMGWVRGVHKWLRKACKWLHHVNGLLLPFCGFIQIFFGGIATMGFCYGGASKSQQQQQHKK